MTGVENILSLTFTIYINL